MIEGIILRINGRDVSSRLSKYKVTKTVKYPKSVQTLNGRKRYFRKVENYEIEFALLPPSDAEVQEDWKAMQAERFSVTFTNPYNGGENSTYAMRVDCDLEAEFGINSCNGKRYYKGGTITLTQAEA